MDRWWRPLNVGLLAGFALLLVGVGLTGGAGGLWGWDAVAYRVDPAAPYALGLGDEGAYLYSPAFAQAVGTLARLVPMDVFLALWTVGAVAALGWLGGRWAALLLLLPPVAMEAWYGNVHLLLATAVVLGFRWPAAWSFVLLTKVTPGVGLAWFAARREWRSLAIALGATAAIAGASFAIAPDLWRQWAELLTAQASRPSLDRLGVLSVGPLWLRLAAAAGIAALGGLLGYRWPVMVACALAMPAVWVTTPAMLVGVIPLAIMDRRDPLPSMLSRRPRPVLGVSPTAR